MTLIDEYSRDSSDVFCQITLRAADRISFAEASRRMRDLRRVIEGLALRHGSRRAVLPERLRSPSTDDGRRVEGLSVWREGPSQEPALVEYDGLRTREIQRADAVWRDARREVRIETDKLPVVAIHYGSPYEILFAVQSALLPGGVVAGSLAALYTIPKVVGAFTNIPTQHAQQLADKEEALLRRERLAAARKVLREQVPVENDAFAPLSYSDVAIQEVASKLMDDETAVVRGIEQIEAVRIEDKAGRSIDSATVESLDY